MIRSEFVKGSSGSPVFLAGGCVFNSQELLRNHVEHARIVCIHFHATARSPAMPKIFFTISNFGYAQPNPRWSADAKSEQFIFRHWPMPQCRKIKTFAFQVCPFRRENEWGWASISRSCWRTPSVDFSNLFAVTPSSPSPPNPQDHNLCRAQPRLTVR